MNVLSPFQQVVINELNQHARFEGYALKGFRDRSARYGLAYAIDWISSNNTVIYSLMGSMARELMDKLNDMSTGVEYDLQWIIELSKFTESGTDTLVNNRLLSSQSSSLYSLAVQIDRVQATTQLVASINALLASYPDHK